MALKKMTIKYWNSLEQGSRYTALRAVFPTFSDSSLKDMAKEKAKELGSLWEIVTKNVKQSDSEWYKTVINKNTYLP